MWSPIYLFPVTMPVEIFSKIMGQGQCELNTNPFKIGQQRVHDTYIVYADVAAGVQRWKS